jgi:hypothetical protein
MAVVPKKFMLPNMTLEVEKPVQAFTDFEILSQSSSLVTNI